MNNDLAKIQNEIKAPKGQLNKFGNYRYRSCEDIVEAAKPILNRYGYSLILSDEVINIGNRFYVKAIATLKSYGAVPVEYSATAYAREEETKKGMDAAQITGAASSYARKYALNGLFAIDDTKDADATNTHEEDTFYTEWQSEVNKCKTEADLTTLWNGNKETCEADGKIRQMFAERKLKVKKTA